MVQLGACTVVPATLKTTKGSPNIQLLVQNWTSKSDWWTCHME